VKRYLEFYEPAARASIEKALTAARARGARTAVVLGTPDRVEPMRDCLQGCGFSWIERDIESFRPSEFTGRDVVVVTGGSGADVSGLLHACVRLDVSVIAPITDHHSGRRTVFLMAIPKAGTHMMIRLFELMGLPRSSARAPRPGTWSTPVGYEYHAPCRELLANDAFDPVGRQLLFRSPAVFVYRNPLDIVVSEMNWFSRADHAFSGYLNSCADDAERVSRLLVDETVMGNLRDRINRFTGWMSFGNVIPVSYEELVGGRGGGSDAQQCDSIWALQLKLHIDGDPEDFGRRIYDPFGPTFWEGKIGRYADYMGEEHLALLGTLPQDFMGVLGYTRDSFVSSRVSELLERPLVIKQIPPDFLYMPRLVQEGFLGWNIVEMAGQYYAVEQGREIASAAEALQFSLDHEGFPTAWDAVSAVLVRASRQDARNGS
jgi:hypothetical protein